MATIIQEGYQSSQMGRAVNPLAPAFEGANPSPSTKNTYFCLFFGISYVLILDTLML